MLIGCALARYLSVSNDQGLKLASNMFSYIESEQSNTEMDDNGVTNFNSQIHLWSLFFIHNGLLTQHFIRGQLRECAVWESNFNPASKNG